MSAVRNQALAAYAADVKRMQDERDEREALRLREEARLDAECLAWVGDPDHSVLAWLFPGTTWMLIDRSDSPTMAVVHPVDDAELVLIVLLGELVARVPGLTPRMCGRERQWLYGSRCFETVTELGAILAADAQLAAMDAEAES